MAANNEVLGSNPTMKANMWPNVSESHKDASNRQFSARAVRDRAQMLQKKFKQQDMANLKKSGTEEQYSERERLLQEIVDLSRETANVTPPLVARANVWAELEDSSLFDSVESWDDTHELTFTPLGTHGDTAELLQTPETPPDSYQRECSPQPTTSSSGVLFGRQSAPSRVSLSSRRSTSSTFEVAMLQECERTQARIKQQELEIRQEEAKNQAEKVAAEKQRIELDHVRLNFEKDKALIEHSIVERRLQMEMESRRAQDAEIKRLCENQQRITENQQKMMEAMLSLIADRK